MMKKLLALLLAVLLTMTLGACGRKEQPTPLSPTDATVAAETYIRAFRTRDFLTRFSLSLYDARSAWETSTIEAHGSAEAFFAEAEKQAKEKGIDVQVDSFDSYYAAYYEFIQADYLDIYGKHTITTATTDSVKVTEEMLASLRTNLLKGPDREHYTKEMLETITEAYLVTVSFSVEGEKKDFSETYQVYVVNYNGRWLVADFTA